MPKNHIIARLTPVQMVLICFSSLGRGFLGEFLFTLLGSALPMAMESWGGNALGWNPLAA